MICKARHFPGSHALRRAGGRGEGGTASSQTVLPAGRCHLKHRIFTKSIGVLGHRFPGPAGGLALSHPPQKYHLCNLSPRELCGPPRAGSAAQPTLHGPSLCSDSLFCRWQARVAVRLAQVKDVIFNTAETFAPGLFPSLGLEQRIQARLHQGRVRANTQGFPRHFCCRPLRLETEVAFLWPALGLLQPASFSVFV